MIGAWEAFVLNDEKAALLNGGAEGVAPSAVVQV